MQCAFTVRRFVMHKLKNLKRRRAVIKLVAFVLKLQAHCS